MNPWPDDARLWRAVDTFRVLALAYAALVFALGSTAHVRPSVGWAVLGVMAAWTALMVGITRRAPSGPPLGLLGADLAAACAAVLATLVVDVRARIASGSASLPASWVAAPALAW